MILRVKEARIPNILNSVASHKRTKGCLFGEVILASALSSIDEKGSNNLELPPYAPFNAY